MKSSIPGAEGTPAYVPGELLVKFKTATLPLDRLSARARLNAQPIKEFRSRAEHWRLGPGQSVEQAVAELRNDPSVQYAEPNYIVEMEYVPNDPMYPDMWDMNNTGQTGGTPGQDIDAERAWNVSTGSHNVMVAVIDTGVDYTHPDLAANIWTNPGEIAGNGIDDDSNGYVDDIHGWDFYNNDNDPFDDNAHGTHCSGTIGAVGDNGIGVAGVNWNVTIVACKFLSSGGSGSTAGAVSAIEYATALGVDIMSNSWGGGGFSQTLLDAINAAGAQEIVFVAAAGNSSADTDVSPHYPSAYPSENIIAVMAHDHNGVRSYWPSCACSSNIGLTTVDLAAPGTDICSTIPGNSYTCTYGGTSMATPHVAGAAALLRAVAPSLPAVTVKQILMDMAVPVPALAGMSVTGARLNAFFPIAEPDDTPPNAVLDLATTAATSNSLFLGWTATGDDYDVGTASTYDMRYSMSPIDDTNFAAATKASGTPEPGPFGTAESMEILGLDAGTLYYFAVKAADEWGNKGPISNIAMGMTLDPPVIGTSVDPDPLEFDLLTGQTATGWLYIDNVGPGTLDWRVPLPTVSGPVTTMQEPLVLEKGEADPRVGDPVVDGFGGPDMFGYRWIDSDDPGGPTYTWNDIALTGTPIAGLDADDETSAAIPLGFDFSFYGNTFDEVHVSTNGWLSFTSTATTYSNQSLPTTLGPENMLAPFWDDLNFGGVERATYYSDGASFIVQYTDVPHYGSGGPYTFQVEIYASGAIHYRYHTVGDPQNQCTVGIQNDTRDDGLTVAFNTDYAHDGLEVRIAAVPQWMTAAPTSGRLYGPDPAAAVALTIDATGLDGGTYEGSVYVQSNDPLNPVVEHPVTLNVTGAPAIQVVPLTLDFGHVYVGFPETLELQINNTGTDALTVSSIVSGDPTVTVDPSSLTVPAHAGATVEVTYTPTGTGGTLSSMLTITSDASNGATVDVSLAGTSAPAPGILVSPNSLSATLYTGGTTDRNLRVTNTGGSPLEVNLSVDLGEAPGAAHVTVYDELALGKEDVDPRAGILGTGGPDMFGYTWSDSDEPGGPMFDWVDISAVGTRIPWTANDDANSGPLPIGFDFPFYGNSFNQVRVVTNGWLSFTSALTAYTNQPLPNSGSSTPENLLAVFWDDLYHRSGTGSEPLPSSVYYYNDGSRFIVQYEHMYRIANYTDDMNFQVILYPNGKIVYQYATMLVSTANSATIGIQNATKNDGLTVVYNNLYIHDNMAIQFSTVPDWLAVSPASATIPVGEYRDFTVAFDAGDLGDALLEGFVNVVSVDPPIELHVPATLTVIGVADAAVDPESVDFGTRFVGYPYREDLRVLNVGTSNLTVTSVTSNDPRLLVQEPVSAGGVFIIPPGESLVYGLRWLAPAPYTMAATVTVNTSDPDEPHLYVPVTGTAIMPPVFGHSPGSFHEDLYVDQTATDTLTLTNAGGSDLEYEIMVRMTDAVVTIVEPVDLAKGEEPKVPGAPQLLSAGGPDMFGYTWKDSDESGGPAFNWFDISTIGTPLPINGDEGNQPAPIGFNFPFYGNTFDTVRVNANGWLSFTSTITGSYAYNNQALPTGGTSYPNNLLAVWWDDMHTQGADKIRYYNDGSRLIVQWTDIRRYSNSGTYTFQAILYPNGKIVYQYLHIENTATYLGSSTIGIQNGARDDGLTICYNDATYIHDEMAIEIKAAADWLTADPLAGTIPPGGSVEIDVLFNPVDLIGGDYSGALTVHTNDPFRPSTDIPATMHVTGYPAIAAVPESLDYGTVFVGVTSDLDVVISNPGTDVLIVTDVAVTGEYSTDTTPFSLAVGETRTLPVTFAPTDDGTRPGSIVLTSNATGVPTLTVALTGDGLWPPIAGVDPASIETALPPEGSKTKEVELCNTGGSDLIWNAGVMLLAGEMVPPDYLEPLEKGDDSRDGTGVGALSAGGPDAFGYFFMDSDETGGPVFDWTDITTIGTVVAGLDADDENVQGIPIGFDFPFYGNTFSTVNFSTNGWLSFTETGTALGNVHIPTGYSTYYPENLLAPFWDDLDFNGVEKAHYYNDGTRFIAQYTDVEHYPSGSSYTFQVILYPNGTIIFQYLSMSGVMNSSTIGIQDDTQLIGLEVNYNNAAYLHDNMAIMFWRTPDWLTIDPMSGVIPAGECDYIYLNLDATGLEEDDYEATISISTNDPFNPLIEVPVLLHVAEVDLDYIRVYPDTLNLSSEGRTIKAVLQLPEPYDPHDIVIESVSIYGQLFALTHPIEYTDENFDGVEELAVKFSRQEFIAVVPEGDDIPVTITGEVRDMVWFTGTDIIRAIRPHVTQPNGGEYLVAGQHININWDAPTTGPTPQSYSVWLDRDGSDELEQLAVGVTGTQLSWLITGPETTVARIMVQAHDGRGVMGSDISDGDFIIAGQLYPPNRAWELMAGRDAVDMALEWKAPLVDLQHGPATSYRLMRATAPQGPWTEVTVIPGTEYLEPLSENPEASLVFYSIIAANAAGDAQ